MVAGDRERWDGKWTEHAGVETSRSALVDLITPWLPTSGRLLDIAGGGSGDAVRFAAQGLDVTVADISDVGLGLTSELAAAAGATVTTVQADLEREPVPDGPWNVITIAYYLNRSLFPHLPRVLAPGGMLGVVIATKHNLERNPRPPAPYLLEPQEIVDLVPGLTVVEHTEEWRENNRHEAWLVARRD